MVSVLSFVHIVLCILVVVLVLIQDPKGAGVGGMFGGGGGSDSLFGATGAPSFLAKLTRYVAILFAASCVLMTIAILRDNVGGGGVLDNRALPVAPKGQNTTTDNATESANGTTGVPSSEATSTSQPPQNESNPQVQPGGQTQENQNKTEAEPEAQ